MLGSGVAVEVSAGLSAVGDELVASVDVAGAAVVVNSGAAADVVEVVETSEATNVVVGISGADVVREIVVEVSDDVSVLVSVSVALTVAVAVGVDVSVEIGVSKIELEVVVRVVLKSEVLALQRPCLLRACPAGEASTRSGKRGAEMAQKKSVRYRILQPATCSLRTVTCNYLVHACSV